VRRFLQVIINSVPVVLMLQNQSHTARRPVTFLHHNTISRSRERCAYRERHINPVMKLAPPSNRMLAPPIRASSIDVISLRPGL
jgi:hypothetical protein